MMEFFKDLEKQLDNFEKTKIPKPIDIDSCILTTDEFLAHLIDMCKNNSVEDIQNEIIFNYGRVFAVKDYGYEAEEKAANFLLTNEKFLTALISILASQKDIYLLHKMFCNKLYISYIMSKDMQDAYPQLYPYYYTLAKIVNYKTMKSLQAVVPENEAVLISAARYYSPDIRMCVNNTNFVILNIKSKTLTVRDIKYIYETLINNEVDILKAYFIYTMMNQDIQDSNLTQAIMSIVDDLPMDRINYLIMSYIKECQENRSALPVYSSYTRASMSYNGTLIFPRVIQAYNQLVRSGFISSDGLMVLKGTI